MVAMGTSFSDQAWGRESAVYRVTGVLTVIGGWFFTAIIAFTVSFIFAVLIFKFKIAAIVGLLILAGFFVFRSYRYHFKKEEETRTIEAFSLKNVTNAETAIQTAFEQTGLFLKEVSDTLGLCCEATVSEDRQRLKDIKMETEKIQTWANVIVANIFKTLFLLHKEDINNTQKYSHTIRSLQDIAESHRDIIMRIYEHFENYHAGFLNVQKEELRQVKTHITRLLWNTSIMLLFRKKVDYDYIRNQKRKLTELVDECDKNQIKRIQNAESKTRLSILFYGILENCLEIAEQTENLLDIFQESFQLMPNEKVNQF
jgi:Na+/phosphate symporter